jgi:iron(III) transport system substrate-binding protein
MLQTILNTKPARTFPLFAIAALALAACGQSAPKDGDSAADGSKGVLNVYSARHYDADEQLYALFERTSGIKLNRIEMKGDQLLERLAAEGKASPADVVLLVDAGNYWRAESRNLLQAVDSPALNAAIPARLRDKDNLWFGLAKRARVIAYNTANVPAATVATYEGLAAPALKGKVCSRPSSNVYNLSLMASLVDAWGPAKAETWAKGVVANFARPPEGSDTDQIKAVAEGKCGAAVVNHYYWVRMMRTGTDEEKALASKVALSFPDQAGAGTHVNISGAAVAANAPNKANAIAFLEFLVSPDAQKILAEANDEFPIVTEAGLGNAELQKLAGFKEAQTPLDVLGVRQSEAQQVFDRAGWR